MSEKKYITLQEAIEGMSEEELERFKKERYEKFIKPMLKMNIDNINKIQEKDENDNIAKN